MPVYECPKCGRTVELPEGKYYCKVCGPSAIMKQVTIPKKSDEVEMGKTLTPTAKNVYTVEFYDSQGKLILRTTARTRVGTIQRVRAIMHPSFAFYVRPIPYKAVVKDEEGKVIFQLDISESWAEAWRKAFGV